ncbi:MAG: hypothetical protein EP349_09625 [Alphaproteobacteria bacterium]|nr:MAG: hypothetical protein EP349_09625 [Alphaproteobacteria bacterium]
MTEGNGTGKLIGKAFCAVALGLCLALGVFADSAAAWSLKGMKVSKERDAMHHDAASSITDLFTKDKPVSAVENLGDLPDFKIKDEESFQKYTVEIHEVPYGETTLSYRLRLPDTWEKRTQHMEKGVQLHKRLMSHITTFMGPPIADVRPSMTIQAKNLEHEIDAAHWLRHYLLVNGFTMTDEVEGKDLKNAAAHFVYVRDEAAYTGYARAIFHGDMVTLARFDVPQRFVKYYGVLQQQAVDKLALVFPKSGTIEEWRRDNLGGELLELQYPSSWVRTRTRYNEDGIKTSFELHNQAEETTVFGLMHFTAIKRSKDTDLPTEIEILKKNLEEVYGLFVREIKSSQPSYGPLEFDYIREEIYSVGFQAERGISDQELRLLVMADSKWYVIFYMMTPLEENDFYNWARNMRAYAIIKDSFL